MASAAQIAANRANSKKSTGPKSYESKCKTRFNSLTHGLRRSAGLFLPGESEAEYHQLSEDVRATLRPRDKAEELLVQKTIRLSWSLTRIETARDERLVTRASEALKSEEEDVEKLGRKLYFDKRGHFTLHGIDVFVNGEERTSSSGKDDDDDRPAAVLKRLESTAKGCRFLVEEWKSIAERVNNNQRVQSHDRFRGTRLLGRDPLDALTDARVALLYLATFALRPGRRFPFADLRGELSKKTFHRYVEKLWIQWPDLLETNDAPKARRLLTELISGAIARLTAKIEAHEAHAEEDAERRAFRARYDPTPQGEQMLRAELRFGGALDRSLAAFWKHRKEKEEFGGMKEEAGELNDEAGIGSDWRQTAEEIGPVADQDGVVTMADPVVDVLSEEQESAAEIEPVEPEPVSELASAETKMTSQANVAQPESAGELASAETKMTSQANLVHSESAGELASEETKMTSQANLARSEGVGEPSKEEKNWWEEDIQPTKGVEVKLKSCKPLVLPCTIDRDLLDKGSLAAYFDSRGPFLRPIT